MSTLISDTCPDIISWDDGRSYQEEITATFEEETTSEEEASTNDIGGNTQVEDSYPVFDANGEQGGGGGGGGESSSTMNQYEVLFERALNARSFTDSTNKNAAILLLNHHLIPALRTCNKAQDYSNCRNGVHIYMKKIQTTRSTNKKQQQAAESNSNKRKREGEEGGRGGEQEKVLELVVLSVDEGASPRDKDQSMKFGGKCYEVDVPDTHKMFVDGVECKVFLYHGSSKKGNKKTRARKYKCTFKTSGEVVIGKRNLVNGDGDDVVLQANVELKRRLRDMLEGYPPHLKREMLAEVKRELLAAIGLNQQQQQQEQVEGSSSSSSSSSASLLLPSSENYQQQMGMGLEGNTFHEEDMSYTANMESVVESPPVPTEVNPIPSPSRSAEV